MDPLSIMASVSSRLEILTSKYRTLETQLSSVRTKIEQTKQVLQISLVRRVLPETTKTLIENIVMEMDSSLTKIEELSEKKLIGKFYLFAGSLFSCFGAAYWGRKLQNLISDMDDALYYARMFIEVNTAGRIDEDVVRGPGEHFQTDSQKRFWKDRCENASFVDYDTLTKALTMVNYDPESVCKHAALGVLSGKNGVTPEAMASAFGDMSPRSWIRSRTRGPSRTIAFAGHVDTVNHVLIQNGWMITCSDDRTIKVFRSSILKHVMVGHERAVSVCCLIENDKDVLLCSGSDDHTVRCWNLDTGVCNFVHATGSKHPIGMANNMNNLLYFCYDSTDIVVINTTNGSPVTRISPMIGILTGIMCSETYLYASSVMGCVCHSDYHATEWFQRIPFVTSKMSFANYSLHYGIICSARRAAIVPNPDSINEIDFPDEVEIIWDIHTCEINGETVFFIAWESPNHLCISEINENMSMTTWTKSLRNTPNGRISTATFDDTGCLSLGLREGSTIYMVREHNYDVAVHVIGCRYGSNYFPEVSSQGNDIPVSSTNKQVLIGPRVQTEFGDSHGVHRNSRQAAILWNINDDIVMDVVHSLTGTICHTSITSEEESKWMLCKRVGSSCWIEKFGMDNKITKHVSIPDNHYPKNIYSMGNQYVVIEFYSNDDEQNSTTKLMVHDVWSPDQSTWSVSDMKVITTMDKYPVLISEGEKGVYYVDFREGYPPKTKAIDYDSNTFGNILHGCDGGDTSIILLTQSSIVYIKDVFAKHLDVCVELSPVESVGLMKISQNKFVLFGCYGRFFVYSMEPLARIKTCVTHPGTTIRSAAARDLVTWDARGAIIAVDRVCLHNISEEKTLNDLLSANGIISIPEIQDE